VEQVTAVGAAAGARRAKEANSHEGARYEPHPLFSSVREFSSGRHFSVGLAGPRFVLLCRVHLSMLYFSTDPPCGSLSEFPAWIVPAIGRTARR
jgi:hypothetical protein